VADLLRVPVILDLDRECIIRPIFGWLYGEPERLELGLLLVRINQDVVVVYLDVYEWMWIQLVLVAGLWNHIKVIRFN
jgi:hypothetical protein